MPILRSQTAASALGNAKKSSDIFEEGAATKEVAAAHSIPSSPCLGPGTPAQDHEAARAGKPKSGPIVRRSRRLSAEISMATAAVIPVEESLGLTRRKANGGRCRIEEGASSAVDESVKGKRKADDSLDAAFRETSSKKTSLMAATTLDESSPGGFDPQVGFEDSAILLSASARKAHDRSGPAPLAKGKGRGRRRRGPQGREAMSCVGIPDDHSMEPLPFDLNQCFLGSSSFDEVPPEAPNSVGSLPAGDGFVHLDLNRAAEDGDMNMVVEEIEGEATAFQVIEDSDDNSSDSSSDLEAGPSNRPQAKMSKWRRGARGRGRRREAEASRLRFQQIARNRAFHFAHFNADGDEAPAGAPPEAFRGRRRGRPSRQINQNRSEPPRVAQQVDWPGPFSTARQLVNNRAEAAAARQSAGAPGSKVSLVDWHPRRVPGDSAFCLRKCPSLQDLCLGILSNNAENIASLEGVPELFRLRISKAICERRKMNAKVLSLFFQGEPSEIHSLDCTQITENELIEMLGQISPSRLEKLHLDNCGRALSERCLLATIASPSTVTLLKYISFRGAYRLSDGGLEALVRASPQLVHLDLSACSFLSDASIKSVANCVSETLESLVLDSCPNLNASVFVHDLVRLQKLHKISLAEVNGVTDEVVSEICVQLGYNLRELVLARCNALTNEGIAAIGPCCPSLQVLDLADLPLLTDIAIAHITDNLRKIQVLNMRRCKFSDEAIAAFVTASGAVIRSLTLNSIHQVSDQAIVALAKHSHECLEFLDLSFCRLVDDECLGFLADACLQLQELKLYGCTQVTNKFLSGHSNPSLKVVGLTSST